MNPIVEEILYPALEDYALDLIIGSGPAARTVRIELKPFTLVGATTRLGVLTTPLRDRFGIPARLEYYTTDQLKEIVARGARLLDLDIESAATNEIARRSRGTPRIANRLLRRVADFAFVECDGRINTEIAKSALTRLGVDELGLDSNDRRYLNMIAHKHAGGPVGLDTIAAALSESRDAVEEVIEPFLLQRGLLHRTPRGRMLSRELGPFWDCLGRKRTANRVYSTKTNKPDPQPVAALWAQLSRRFAAAEFNEGAESIKMTQLINFKLRFMASLG